jgi:hypothetical protein
VRIIGPPSVQSVDVLWSKLGDATAVFRQQIVPALWDAAVRYGIDPVGAVAQSYKETARGFFGGKVSVGFFNPCGLKVRDQGLHPDLAGDLPLAHAMFPSWEVGAVAQVQHLRAYAGWPVDDLVVDPRYVWVIGKHRCETFQELGGKWAPSPTYGTEIVAIANRLRS